MKKPKTKNWWLDNKKLERWAFGATIISFPILAVTMAVILWQVIDVRRIAASQNNIALNTSFFNGSTSDIVGALEDDKPILKQNGGQFTTRQLDNYLGTFETIDEVYTENLLTEDALCVSFSYYITLTVKNKEIQKYLAANPDFFGGISELRAVVESSKNRNCR